MLINKKTCIMIIYIPNLVQFRGIVLNTVVINSRFLTISWAKTVDFFTQIWYIFLSTLYIKYGKINRKILNFFNFFLEKLPELIP